MAVWHETDEDWSLHQEWSERPLECLRCSIKALLATERSILPLLLQSNLLPSDWLAWLHELRWKVEHHRSEDIEEVWCRSCLHRNKCWARGPRREWWPSPLSIRILRDNCQNCPNQVLWKWWLSQRCGCSHTAHRVMYTSKQPAYLLRQRVEGVISVDEWSWWFVQGQLQWSEEDIW